MKSTLSKYTTIFLVFLLSGSQVFSQCPFNDEWPPAIVEMHYNNTGPDVNEYIEVHQYSLACQLPNPYNFFDEIKFYDNLGILYKTLPISSMQVYFVPGGSGHAFFYYQFPAIESFADNGTIRLLNNYSGALVLAEYIYNSTGITENRYFFFTSQPYIPIRTFPTIEDETTPIGSSLNFCGYYMNSSWNTYIMASSYGTLNACTVLLVNLTSFDYTLKNRTVQLKWETASETNTDYFDVERSTDGINFQSIGRIQSSGVSNSPKQYSLTDIRPNYINYYRLKIADKDGKIAYSKTLFVKYTTGNPLVLLQNIVTDNLPVKVGLDQNLIGAMQIFDLSGRALLHLRGKTGNQDINVSTLSAGSYVIRLQTTDGKAYSKQFVKQ